LKRQLDGSTVSVATADLDQVRIVGDVTVSSPTVNSVYMTSPPDPPWRSQAPP
jgi:hypothetical protein